MADNINTETDTQQQTNVPDEKGQELAEQMNLALGLNQPINSNTQATSQATEENNSNTQVVANANTTENNAVAQAATTESQAQPSSFEILKERFQYQSPEDAIKEIEEYRKYKENPVAEIEFENEESRKYFEAVKAGKMKEANEIVSKQQEIESVLAEPLSKDNAEKVIKLNWRLKYGLEPEQIEYKYKKQFGVKKEPKAESFVDDTEFEQAHAEWEESVHNAEMDKMIEAKLLHPELQNYKQNLVLPDIEQDVDEDYLNWKTQKENSQQLQEHAVQAYKSFTPKTIETKINFNDEANKVAFEFQHEPSEEDFGKAVDMVTDINKFYSQFIGQDGKPDREGFLKAIYFAVNRDKIITDAINQSKNATIKAQLPRNNGNNVQRHQPDAFVTNELQEQMNLALNGYKRN